LHLPELIRFINYFDGFYCIAVLVVFVDSLTRFEKARLISARALQVALGAPVLVKLSKADTNPIDIAKHELEKGVLPLAVLREYPSGEVRRIDAS
jgi:DNA-directed RNA polymerase subunit K/omega